MLTRTQALLSFARDFVNALLGDLGRPDFAIDPRVSVTVNPDTGTRCVRRPLFGNVRPDPDGGLLEWIRADRVEDAIRAHKAVLKGLEGAR